jgi:hypothetical protein
VLDLILPSRTGLRALIKISLGRSDSDSVGYIKNIVLKLGADEISLAYNDKGGVGRLTVMGEGVQPKDDQQWVVGQGKLIPNLDLFERTYYETDDQGNGDWFWEHVSRPFFEDVIKALADLAHGNTKPDRLSAIASRLQYGEAAHFYEHIKSISADLPALAHKINQCGANSYEVWCLRRAVLISKLPGILKTVDDELESFSQSVRYVEPLRATAERYYRRQDLAVNEIDSRGANTAMFLNSLSEVQLSNLRDWMSKSLGFSVSMDVSAGHVELKINDGQGSYRNIADLGFGYSQMLPIILQVWRSGQGGQGITSEVVAIEQPELHLHPHYQSLLADLICTSAIKGRSRVFIETHSDHFINRLGYLVAEGKLDPRNVQIIVVSDHSGESTVRTCDFDSDGLLGDNWPAGFFSAGH